MYYQGRELRRLWKVVLYNEDPDTIENLDDLTTREEKVIAWNAVDAIRRSKDAVAERPEPECFVTWDDPPLKIFSVKTGPQGLVADPTIDKEGNFGEELAQKKRAKKQKKKKK
jgi:hypothetical protein